jgi:HK97 family phage portal protein
MLGRLFNQQTRALTSASVWGHTSTANPWGSWPGDPGYGDTGGAGSALQLTTVLGCVRLISDSISTLPVDVFRRSGGESIPAKPPTWLTEPTVDLDFASWCGQILASLLLHGNAYVKVNRSESTSAIVELIPLDPQTVSIQRHNGAKSYLINNRAGAEILHIKGLMLPGSDLGMNPIAFARSTIGLGLASLKYGSEFFESDGNMPGVIEMSKIAQPQTKVELAQQWQRRRRSGGKGLPGILDDGATWKPTGVSNEDAQFLATRGYTAAEIAGALFLLDPSDLGIPVTGTSLTYANLEQRNARRVQVTFLPWMTRIESAVNGLLSSPGYMKFNVNALLRGDLKTRYESYEIGIRSSFLQPNEARELEDLPPLDVAETSAPSVRDLAEMIQKIYLGVGVVLTVEEARQILNDGGANLVGNFQPPQGGQT